MQRYGLARHTTWVEAAVAHTWAVASLTSPFRYATHRVMRSLSSFMCSPWGSSSTSSAGRNSLTSMALPRMCRSDAATSRAALPRNGAQKLHRWPLCLYAVRFLGGHPSRSTARIHRAVASLRSGRPSPSVCQPTPAAQRTERKGVPLRRSCPLRRANTGHIMAPNPAHEIHNP